MFGRDFKPDLPAEEIEYLNKAVLVAMEERKKKVEVNVVDQGFEFLAGEINKIHKSIQG